MISGKRLPVLIFIFLLTVAAAVAQLPPESENVIPFRILMTGNTANRLEVCGCTIKTRGGVSPRAYQFDQFSRGVSRVLRLDAGRIFLEPEAIDRRISDTYLQAMSMMEYDALLVTAGEFIFGADFLIEQLRRWNLTAVGTNIECPSGTPTGWRKVHWIEFPRLKVAVLGITQVPDYDLPEPYQVADPIDSASKALEQVRGKADLTIVLSDLLYDREKEMIRSLEGIDLVLSSQKGSLFRNYYHGVAIHSDFGGQTINVIDANYKPPLKAMGQQAFTFIPRAVNILPEEGVDPEVRQVVDEFYQELLQEQIVQHGDIRLFTEQEVESLPGNAYTGSESCMGCHADEYAQWQETQHARAYLDLMDLNRYMLPELLPRFTTGFGYPGGFNDIGNPDDPMANVGCESCHGPGQMHLLEPENKDWIRLEVPDSLCRQCHIPLVDPEYEDNRKQRRQAILHHAE